MRRLGSVAAVLEHDGADTVDGEEQGSVEAVAPSQDSAVATAVDDADTDGMSNAEPRWTRTDWYVCAGLMVLSLLLVGLHVRAYTTLSFVDELQHVDYMIKAGDLDIPHRNDRVGQEAMAEAACRSVDAPGYSGPACGLAEYDPDDFQERGVNTAAGGQPAYYVATGLAARAIVATGLIDSKVTAGRLIGGAWLGLAWCVVWYTMARLRIRRIHRGASLSMLMATPLIVFYSATINADVSLLLTGALTVLATVVYDQRSDKSALAGVLLVLAYLAILFVEPTNTLVVAMSATYLLAAPWFRTPVARRDLIAPAAALVIAAVFRLEIMDRMQDWWFPASPRTAVAPMFEGREVFEFSWTQVWQQLPAVFTPISNTYVSPPLSGQFTIMLLQLANWTFIGLMFTGAMVYVANRRAALFSRLTLAALLLAGPFYTFYYAWFSDVFYPAPGRFGLPLVAPMAIVAAGAMRTRAATAVSLMVGGTAVVYTIAILAF
jgi:hypothetical protein